MTLNALSTPSFIWRPSSLADPENGADMPNRISVSVTPRLTAANLDCSGLVAVSAGDVAVALGRAGCGPVSAGATTVGSERAWPGGVSACDGVTVFSRSASARSVAPQVVRLLAMAEFSFDRVLELRENYVRCCECDDVDWLIQSKLSQHGCFAVRMRINKIVISFQYASWSKTAMEC